MKIKNFYYLTVAAACLLFASCATTLAVDVEQPAKLNLNGAKTISILPFQATPQEYFSVQGFFSVTSSRIDSDERQIVNSITRNVQNSILESNYLTVVDSRTVESAIENSAEIPCDVYLTGSLENYNTSVDREYRTMDDGTENVYYNRAISFNIVYSVIDAKTNSIISSDSFRVFETSTFSDDYDDIPSPLDLVSDKIEEFAQEVRDNIQPHMTTRYISLMEDKEDPLCVSANEAAKNGDLDRALSLYSESYVDSDNYKAGYNAGLVLNAQGKFQEAVDLLTDVYETSGDKKVFTALKSAKSDLEATEKTKQQKALQEK